MQTVINSLAVLAFAGVILLLFANSALLKLVREQQAALAELRLGRTRVEDRSHLVVPAMASNDGRPTFALVVDARCPACADRARHFAALAGAGSSSRMAAVSVDEETGRWFDDTAVSVHIDAALVGQIGVAITPTVIHYDSQGREQWRRAVGTDADLDRLILPIATAGAGTPTAAAAAAQT
jgi:hypothetical protein